MQHTNTYQFPLPEAHDTPSRALVHETAQKAEAALLAQAAELAALNAAKAEIVTGSYVGDGTENRFISLGFTPKAVLVEYEDGSRLNSIVSQTGGIALPGKPCGGSIVTYISIQTNGFAVSARDTTHGANGQGGIYYYLVLR